MNISTEVEMTILVARNNSSKGRARISDPLKPMLRSLLVFPNR